ncbi:hypothetical protein BHU72_08370 [Desulfuribacillus stibiiarsenatis]|uniref:VTT domain-containing protein n=1 Tax=Desulfuribacillus stibiiarsenatis TaxID=1390249 RepID=A0A1E5L3W9_9FIRM|nr:DedA family protein [Desulfuribacillus stibiiarsenatis]OEH84832.1 hypothetical protein BHU72_08370 [Desulfuribacillus stibiiarsenatis]
MGIIDNIFTLLIPWFSTYGLLIIFVVMLLETIWIPMPGEFILPFAGYMVLVNQLVFVEVMFVAITGCLIGSSIAYFIGYAYGRMTANYFLGKRRKLAISFIKTTRWFQSYGETTVIWGRSMPLIRISISYVAGMFKMNYLKFLSYSFLGWTLWCTILLSIGLFLGEKWENIISYLPILTGIILFIIIVIVSRIFYTSYYLNHKAKK